MRIVYIGVFVLSLTVLATRAAGQEVVGVWRMNVAQSTFGGPPYAKATIQIDSADSGGYKTVMERADIMARVVRQEFAVRFDGMEHPVDGARVPTTLTYKWIDDRTFEYVQKWNGQIVATVRLAVSADGRTLTETGTDGAGRRDVIVYEK
jgi:hypothetical protein